jgi:hypothetical protein
MTRDPLKIFYADKYVEVPLPERKILPGARLIDGCCFKPARVIHWPYRLRSAP